MRMQNATTLLATIIAAAKKSFLEMALLALVNTH